MTHTYKFVQTIPSERGSKWRLRRDDGKRVEVSRKRFNELSSEGRIVDQHECTE